MPDDSSPEFRTSKYEWLRSKIPMDLADLDQEVIELPVLIQEAGECVSIANELRDRSRDEFERLKASIGQQLRDDLLPNGKIRSESMIEAQIPCYAQYKVAQDALGKARLDAALWSTITDALRTKSMNIRVVADLMNSGFITSDYIRTSRRRAIREAVPMHKQETQVSS
jgi:hypothetical protein